MNYLVSFADSRMYRSLKRLNQQAINLNFFDRLFLVNEKFIPNRFRKKFKDRLILGSKGYGFWSWKPEIILKILNKINYNDCLIYVDAGCHLNKSGKKRLIEYFDILKKNSKGILAFQAQKPNKNNSKLKYDGRKLRNLKNYKWIKGDLLDYFNVRNKISVIKAQEIAGGVLLIKKNKKSINMIKEWRKIVNERFDLITDDSSISPNLKGFVENRHDQAIWTLLCLKYKVKTISSYEFWYPRKNSKKIEADWNALKYFPIHAKRDKNLGLRSKINFTLSRKIFQIKNIFSKIGLINQPQKPIENSFK